MVSAWRLLREALKTSWEVFKIMIPISVLVKLLGEAGVIEYLGIALEPVMGLMGLPGSMGLVWATAMIAGFYGGVVAFASLAPQAHLTVAQATVITTMVLVAHSMPIEVRIAQKAGPRLGAIAILRISVALIIGWGLHQVYALGGFLQTPHVSLWTPPPQNPSWMAWARSEAQTLFSIFLIIVALLFLMKVLERLGAIVLLARMLGPLLTALGMNRAAAPITIVGLTLGFTYGGALIIQEARSGRLGGRDVFFSIALMSLSHSIIEDTLFMMALGAHPSGTLGARFLLSLLVVSLLVRLFHGLSDETFSRLLCPLSSPKVTGET
jgi:hypothetical protein